ncbi:MULTISPECIES: LysE family translocator [Butyricimonas]|jgi:threonine/homoserine/homoserine lactone efflux protein|uniref:LysE family transporter n=1 Tax=Butyricimonas virosa TaxID=544645 RepID=A0A415QBI0_9BACT|nr:MULTISPECIES: LysE family transporter [Butyricimonas]MBS5626257.1 LysE family transporter [Porphyromonadaceae bacterium]MBO4958115.1 LysE family transporter [Butyricimonas sp.]MBQ6792266.1 LysE family transporter [Butyricimonas sp.]MBR5463903.1 LysE family transporter [Butyricimonas sp.]MCI6413908.1 LysE family transporter [Butyricimonas virosa]
MYDILYLFKGMLVGLMVSIPLGPMGVLIIQKTLHKGALSGFIAGMGAASADFFYASVAAFGLGYVINTVQTHELLLQIIGGIFLLCIGLKIYFDNPIRQIRQRRQGRVSKTGLLGDYLSLFFLTVSNPITVVVFMAVFAGMSVFGESSSMLGELLVVMGVLLGGGVWWYTLSTLVNIFRKKFRLRVLITINRVSGLVITILGALVILAAFAPFKNLVIH